MTSKAKASIAYLGLFVTGIFFLVVEQNDEFVRKSAAQSVTFGITVTVINYLLKNTPFIGYMIKPAFFLTSVIILGFLVYKAIENVYYKLPFIGDISEKYVLNWFKK